MAIPTVAIIGTCDTKLEELLYVHDQLTHVHNVQVKLIDVGRTPTSHPCISISQSTIFASSGLPGPSPDLSVLPRGEVISTLIAHTTPLLRSLHASGDIHAVISLGGSGGSSLAAGVMRAALPLGFPKLIVSTMAAGDVSAFVGETDLTMMYSVVDIAGLNDILCPILANAAGAIAGMARAYHARLLSPSPPPSPHHKRIAISMFGVTTPAVTHARTLLATYPCTSYVFHATGAGGRALEKLVSQRFFDGVLDLTTTELADELVGGVLSAGPSRLATAGAPRVVSLGALDMVNFGPCDSVPESFRGRRLYAHNPSVTLMRTTPAECAQLGRRVAERVRGMRAEGTRVEVWVPRGGVSALSVRGAPFWDAEADEALFRALADGLRDGEGKGEGIRLVEDDRDVNDEGFVRAMVMRLVEMVGLQPLTKR